MAHPLPAREDEPALHSAGAALALLAGVLAHDTLEAAALALAQGLARETGAACVAIGLRERQATRLLASSDSAPVAGDASQPLRDAMDEALDAGEPLAWPSTDALHAVCRAHRALAEVHGPLATVPIGVHGEPRLAATLQTAAPLADGQLERTAHLLALAAPALAWLARAEAPWTHRTCSAFTSWRASLRRPERRGTRRALGVAALALLALAVLPLEQDVAGRARIEGAEQRTLVAPSDGFIQAAHVRPGDRVSRGAALIDLAESDLRLERERWASQLAQHENAYAGAMARTDRVAAGAALARMQEAQAQLGLVEEQLARSRITAPFDGLVVQGDLAQSAGAPVRQGDALLVLATTERQRVVVEVDETDIAGVAAGQRGGVALSALPWRRTPFVVERITPIAKALEGRNVFEVHGRLESPPAELRPGLLGRANIVVGRTPPLWSFLGSAARRARVAVWSWIG